MSQPLLVDLSLRAETGDDLLTEDDVPLQSEIAGRLMEEDALPGALYTQSAIDVVSDTFDQTEQPLIAQNGLDLLTEDGLTIINADHLWGPWVRYQTNLNSPSAYFYINVGQTIAAAQEGSAQQYVNVGQLVLNTQEGQAQQYVNVT